MVSVEGTAEGTCALPVAGGGGEAGRGAAELAAVLTASGGTDSGGGAIVGCGRRECAADGSGGLAEGFA